MTEPTKSERNHEDCPDKAKHTRCPEGYVAFHVWAEKKMRTHDSTKCPTCGFYTIWIKRPSNKPNARKRWPRPA